MSDELAHIVLDVDWAPDPVLSFALDLLEELRLQATVFVTHDTPLLDRLRAMQGVEVGIHPNFNDLLQGTAPPGASALQRVADLMHLVPEARSVRSHSLAQSTRLIDLFADAGLTHEANSYLPVRSGMVLRAWRNWDDRIVRVPFYFEDSAQDPMKEGWDVDLHVERSGLRVLNFHPIRLYLNARAVELPVRYGPADCDLRGVDVHRRGDDQTGSRWFLERFVEAHRHRGGRFGRISEIKVSGRLFPREPTHAG